MFVTNFESMKELKTLKNDGKILANIKKLSKRNYMDFLEKCKENF